MAAACYISSYAYEPPHTKAPWYAKAKEEDKKVLDRLRLVANFRASQTGKEKLVNYLISISISMTLYPDMCLAVVEGLTFGCCRNGALLLR